MKYLVKLVFVFSLFSGPASFAQSTGGYYDGNQLYDLCRKELSKSPSDGGICRGYILGVADMLVPVKETCVPQNISARKIVTKVYKYMGDNPLLREYSAYIPVTSAFIKIWPCE